MNPLEMLDLSDVQGQVDERGVAIDHVGIEDLDYPITVIDRDGEHQATVRAALGVALPADVRGTHMSRFVSALDEHRHRISGSGVQVLLRDVLERLDASDGHIELQFQMFLDREAPVSGQRSLMGYEGVLAARTIGNRIETTYGVRVAITSLCPCSKEISAYGAHNQRGYVEIQATGEPPLASEPLWLADLIDVAESAASAPLYPLLKRADERHVTMQAYDNPAFVEDIVRDAAIILRRDRRIAAFRVKATNQESIHNHNAVATVSEKRS